MQSLVSLNNLEKTATEILSLSKNNNNFLSGLTTRNIHASIHAIENRFRVDYSKPIKISDYEIQRLKQMLVVFIKTKKDTFNTHYIQLLAWHITELRVMKVKTKYGEISQSFLEYSPSPLLPFSATNKIFTLFYENRIKNTEKVATALLMNYLNNYKCASTRFKNLLRRYLKSIKYSKDVDVYFSMAIINRYLVKHYQVIDTENYKKKVTELLGIPDFALKTMYFKDALDRGTSHES